MTRVVFITQQFDPEDPQIAIVVPQVAAIARRVDEVVVIADRIVADALPPNGRAYSFHSSTKVGRGLRVLAAVARELPGLRKGRGMVIAHMSPIYAIIVAPLVRPAGVPLVLWWSHWKMDRVVRLGERVSTRVVSVGPGTFPLASKKLVTVGQAIDVDSFGTRAARAEGPLRIVVIGRYSAAKGVGTIIRAAGLALSRGTELQLDVYGPALTPDARAEHDSLEALVRELDPSERRAPPRLGHPRRSRPPACGSRPAREQRSRRRRPNRLRGSGLGDPGARLESRAHESARAGCLLQP